MLGSARSGALGIDDASAHVASTFFITSVGSDAGDEGSAGVAGAFAKSAGSDALVIDDGPAHVASTSLIKSAGSGGIGDGSVGVAGAFSISFKSA